MDLRNEKNGFKCEAVAVYSLYSEDNPCSIPPKAYGCSGILWEHRGKLWGLTHGSILFPFFENAPEEKLKKFIKSLYVGERRVEDREILDKIELQILRENASNFSARITTVWSCLHMLSGFQSLMDSGWDFIDNDADDHHRSTLSMLVVFVPADAMASCKPKHVSESLATLLAQLPTSSITRGTPVLAVSSPFAGTLVSADNPPVADKPTRVGRDRGTDKKKSNRQR